MTANGVTIQLYQFENIANTMLFKGFANRSKAISAELLKIQASARVYSTL